MTPRGQTSHKPRGRKPRHDPVWSGETESAMGIGWFAVEPMLLSSGSTDRCHRADTRYLRRKAGVLDDAAVEQRRYRGVGQSRPLSAVADAKQTDGCGTGFG